MGNIFLIPTVRESRLWRDLDSKELKINVLFKPNSNQCTKCSNEYMYITDDSETKEGDWCIDKFNQKWKLEGEKLIAFDMDGNKRFTTENLLGHEYKKIVLTTDQGLIKDGVQSIDDEFLQWFVKNPSCEEIEVYKDKRLEIEQDFDFYEIIIPTEKRKTNLERLPFPELVKEFTDYYKNIPLVEVPKQERTYSEEDIIPLINALRYFTDRVENGTIRSKTTYKMYKEILNQFKIK